MHHQRWRLGVNPVVNRSVSAALVIPSVDDYIWVIHGSFTSLM